MIDLDFRLEQGTFVLEARERLDGRVTVLFGPSGSGKTTILDAIAGLRQPTRGSIVVNGRHLFDSAQKINLPPHKRHVGYVSQDIALFPHLDVRRNVTYGQRPGRSCRSNRSRRFSKSARCSIAVSPCCQAENGNGSRWRAR